MAFYTAAEFRVVWDVVEQIGDIRIEFCQLSAQSELVRLCGNDAVTDTAAGTPSNTVRAAALKSAHAFLTAETLVWNTGTRMRPFGLTKAERDLDASVQSNTQTEYQSAKDVEILAKNLHLNAEKTLAPYLLTLSGDEEVADAPAFDTGIVTTADASCGCC